ncbi:hypothetical protein H8K90_14075 [Winogradskyella echinorum]|uniref:LTXXQ motif family protein n=1 Tax=Winogradskyella echinorum TaxID=538189 RepID=A0ABR6Y5L4_9FLAO|nr:hypothetical protein [Winogradskyella echinorum]MBC3847520.1 hypothetical protein [Winogradskyella echinorum]MBC5751868.1 hypothetical protein [Winogradskyella echinorum]
MKKVITLCLFAFVMILGTESIMAQNSKLENRVEVNTEASEKTEALRKHIKFTNDQRDQIYNALKVYGQAKASIKGKPSTEEEKAKIEKQLDDKVKLILSDEQYERYKAYILEN